MHRTTLVMTMGWFIGVLAYEHPILLWVLLICLLMMQRHWKNVIAPIAYVLCVVACVGGFVRNTIFHTIHSPQDGRLTYASLIVRDQKNTWQQQKLVVTDVNDQHYLITLPLNPQYQRGSGLVISAIYVPWSEPYDEYHAQLRRNRVIGELVQSTIHATRMSATPVAYVEHLRTTLWHHIHRYFPEPVASVVAGMLLGVTGDVDDTTATAFRMSGTSHILVISGWNITIVATLCAAIIRRINPQRYVALFLPLGVIALYVVFTGASAAVIRAGVMGSIIVIGKWIHRPRSMINIITIAVMGISIVDPSALWDVGMQLSTLATVGLVAFATPIEQWLAKHIMQSTYLEWAREGVASTIAAQIPTFPIMLCRLDLPTIWSLLANTIITPVVPLAMASGTLFLCATLIHPHLAYVTAWLAYPSFAWIVTGALVIATWPATGILIPTMSSAWIEGALHAIWIFGWYGIHRYHTQPDSMV